MSLTLNEAPQKFKEFYGKNVEQMPLLIAEGRTPLPVAGHMQRRIETRNASEEVRSSWIDNYFDTGDAIVLHPSEYRLKVILDSEDLRQVNSESKLYSGALVLPEDSYDGYIGQEFTLSTLEGYLSPCRDKKKIKENPILRVVARDKNLLNDFVDFVFSEGDRRWGNISYMGFSPSAPPLWTTLLRPLRIDFLAGHTSLG